MGQTERIADSAKLVKLIPQTQLTIAIFVGIILAILLQVMLDRTVFGYEIQAVSYTHLDVYKRQVRNK